MAVDAGYSIGKARSMGIPSVIKIRDEKIAIGQTLFYK
jgi:hypothetical protein